MQEAVKSWEVSHLYSSLHMNFDLRHSERLTASSSRPGRTDRAILATDRATSNEQRRRDMAPELRGAENITNECRMACVAGDDCVSFCAGEHVW